MKTPREVADGLIRLMHSPGSVDEQILSLWADDLTAAISARDAEWQARLALAREALEEIARPGSEGVVIIARRALTALDKLGPDTIPKK